MLTLTKRPPGPGFPLTSSLFFEVVAKEFFLNDLIGGHPTTCALSNKEEDTITNNHNFHIKLHNPQLKISSYLAAGALLLLEAPKGLRVAPFVA